MPLVGFTVIQLGRSIVNRLTEPLEFLHQKGLVEFEVHNPENINYIEESKVSANQLFAFKSDIPMVGASGAVFGILLAFAMLFPNMQLMLLFPPIPVKAKYFVPNAMCVLG